VTFSSELLSSALDDASFTALDHVMDWFAPEGPYLTFAGPSAAHALSTYGRTVLAQWDSSPAVLDGHDLTDVEIRHAGPYDPLVFPAGRFGIVHARWSRVEGGALTNLTRWLRPGGILLVEAPDDYPAGVLPKGPYRSVAQAALERLQLQPALDLPARLMRYGLDYVGCRHEAPVGDAFQVLLRDLLERGTPWPEIHAADLRDWANDPAAKTPALMNIIAWGLKR
jgi:hypothetical protein